MDRARLLASGFVTTQYDGQPGEFLVKRAKVEDMPYAREHLIDNNLIYGYMEAVTELTPGGMVQLYIAEADYLEGPVAVASDEGSALLADAVAAL